LQAPASRRGINRTRGIDKPISLWHHAFRESTPVR